jgi:hypothetical protein
MFVHFDPGKDREFRARLRAIAGMHPRL